MTATRAMTPAEFVCTRELLGLPITWVAENLGVTERTVYRWENGTFKIPATAAQRMQAWSEMTQQAVGVVCVEARNNPSSPLTVRRNETGRLWPAPWYRIVVARAAEITGSTIEWEP